MSFVDRIISVQEAFSGINAHHKSPLFVLLMHIAVNLDLHMDKPADLHRSIREKIQTDF